MENYKAILINAIDIFHQWQEMVIDLENLKGMNEIITKLQLNTSNANEFKDLYAKLKAATPVSVNADIIAQVMEIEDTKNAIIDLEQKISEQDLSEPEHEQEQKQSLLGRIKGLLGY